MIDNQKLESASKGKHKLVSSNLKDSKPK